MRNRFLLSAATALVLGACAGTPYPEAVTDIEPGQRREYWLDRDPFVQADYERCSPGHVTALFTIGSDGGVYDISVLESRPMSVENERFIRNDLWERRFVPAPGNPDRRAIRVTQTFFIDCGPGTPKWR